MTDKLQALWQNRDELFIKLSRDVHAAECPVDDHNTIEFSALAFFNEFGSILGFRSDKVAYFG